MKSFLNTEPWEVCNDYCGVQSLEKKVDEFLLWFRQIDLSLPNSAGVIPESHGLVYLQSFLGMGLEGSEFFCCERCRRVWKF